MLKEGVGCEVLLAELAGQQSEALLAQQRRCRLKLSARHGSSERRRAARRGGRHAWERVAGRRLLDLGSFFRLRIGTLCHVVFVLVLGLYEASAILARFCAWTCFFVCVPRKKEFKSEHCFWWGRAAIYLPQYSTCSSNSSTLRLRSQKMHFAWRLRHVRALIVLHACANKKDREEIWKKLSWQIQPTLCSSRCIFSTSSPQSHFNLTWNSSMCSFRKFLQTKSCSKFESLHLFSISMLAYLFIGWRHSSHLTMLRTQKVWCIKKLAMLMSCSLQHMNKLTQVKHGYAIDCNQVLHYYQLSQNL